MNHQRRILAWFTLLCAVLVVTVAALPTTSNTPAATPDLIAVTNVTGTTFTPDQQRLIASSATLRINDTSTAAIGTPSPALHDTPELVIHTPTVTSWATEHLNWFTAGLLLAVLGAVVAGAYRRRTLLDEHGTTALIPGVLGFSMWYAGAVLGFLPLNVWAVICAVSTAIGLIGSGCSVSVTTTSTRRHIGALFVAGVVTTLAFIGGHGVTLVTCASVTVMVLVAAFIPWVRLRSVMSNQVLHPASTEKPPAASWFWVAGAVASAAVIAITAAPWGHWWSTGSTAPPTAAVATYPAGALNPLTVTSPTSETPSVTTYVNTRTDLNAVTVFGGAPGVNGWTWVNTYAPTISPVTSQAARATTDAIITDLHDANPHTTVAGVTVNTITDHRDTLGWIIGAIVCLYLLLGWKGTGKHHQSFFYAVGAYVTVMGVGIITSTFTSLAVGADLAILVAVAAGCAALVDQRTRTYLLAAAAVIAVGGVFLCPPAIAASAGSALLAVGLVWTVSVFVDTRSHRRDVTERQP